MRGAKALDSVGLTERIFKLLIYIEAWWIDMPTGGVGVDRP